MPHVRKRFLLQKLLKKLSFHPILAIQGARQTGKSYLAKHLLAPKFKNSKVLTFDQESVRTFAENSCESFLEEYSDKKPFIIDEAQKVPKLFDALKFSVDENRVPGRFVILGSTEFSKQTLIRESLTGRMGRVRLFPLSLKESLHDEIVSRKTLLRYLKKGGLPGIFSVHSQEEWTALIQDWINLTCYRDIQEFKKLKLDSEICFKILKATSTLEEPSKFNISKTLRLDPRRVETHLTALKDLFVIYKLDPHPSGVGKSLYLPFDVGVAHFFEASIERKLHVLLINERFVRASIEEEKLPLFSFYKSLGAHYIHLIEETSRGVTAFQIKREEKIKLTDSALMNAFLEKNKAAKGALYAPLSMKMKVKQITILPWENFIYIPKDSV